MSMLQPSESQQPLPSYAGPAGAANAPSKNLNRGSADLVPPANGLGSLLGRPRSTLTGRWPALSRTRDDATPVLSQSEQAFLSSRRGCSE